MTHANLPVTLTSHIHLNVLSHMQYNSLSRVFSQLTSFHMATILPQFAQLTASKYYHSRLTVNSVIIYQCICYITIHIYYAGVFNLGIDTSRHSLYGNQTKIWYFTFCLYAYASTKRNHHSSLAGIIVQF